MFFGGGGELQKYYVLTHDVVMRIALTAAVTCVWRISAAWCIFFRFYCCCCVIFWDLLTSQTFYLHRNPPQNPQGIIHRLARMNSCVYALQGGLPAAAVVYLRKLSARCAIFRKVELCIFPGPRMHVCVCV